MGEGLAEVNDEMLNVCVSVKSERVGLFLFGNSFAVNTLAHNVVKVFNWYGAEVEHFNDFNFEVRGVGSGPSLDHTIHELTGVLVKEDSDQVDDKIFNAFLTFEPAQCEVELLVVSVELLELEEGETLHGDFVVLGHFGDSPAAGHGDEELSELA